MARRVGPEDLVTLTIQADAIRRASIGGAPVRYRPGQRVWVEPFFNLVGWVIGSVHAILPWPLRRRLDLRINSLLAGHAPEENPVLPARMDEAVALARRLQAETGHWPAMMVLTSHPETEGPLEWLRFEVLRQGLVIANAVAEAQTPGAWFRPAPQCFLAIDPYALDTVSPPVAGVYAAWMNRIYIAWDRQPSTQSWLQRWWFLRESSYSVIGWRLLRRLRRNPVAMVVSGGLPHNARLLYAAREMGRALASVRRVAPRPLEHALLSLLIESVADEPLPSASGVLSPRRQERLMAWLESIGMPAAEAGAWVAQLSSAIAPEVPLRRRLLRVLVRRFAERGLPLLITCVSHRPSAPHVAVAPALALYAKGGRLWTVRGAGPAEAVTDLDAVAREVAELFRA